MNSSLINYKSLIKKVTLATSLFLCSLSALFIATHSTLRSRFKGRVEQRAPKVFLRFPRAKIVRSIFYSRTTCAFCRIRSSANFPVLHYSAAAAAVAAGGGWYPKKFYQTRISHSGGNEAESLFAFGECIKKMFSEVCQRRLRLSLLWGDEKDFCPLREYFTVGGSVRSLPPGSSRQM